jgi:hypothetical protein
MTSYHNRYWMILQSGSEEQPLFYRTFTGKTEAEFVEMTAYVVASFAPGTCALFASEHISQFETGRGRLS